MLERRIPPRHAAVSPRRKGGTRRIYHALRRVRRIIAASRRVTAASNFDYMVSSTTGATYPACYGEFGMVIKNTGHKEVDPVAPPAQHSTPFDSERVYPHSKELKMNINNTVVQSRPPYPHIHELGMKLKKTLG
ncbi:hypothetical protein B0H11DRAFT_1924539 [Mycena galericulata]|nr:hypothetical protein B0H11DRAFT_1924539 [Mycena galericulata]